MKRAVIVQARMGSSRLPGKILLPLAGRAMLGRVIDRLRESRLTDEIVIATTDLPSDEPVVAFAIGEGVRVVRGDSDDVLARYGSAARASGADLVARVTSDCPFVDAAILDHAFRVLERGPGCDYVSNRGEPRTFPRGLDVEVFTRAALERAEREARDAASREHVTLYLYEHPGRATIRWIRWRRVLEHIRLTVDTREDYELANRLYERLGSRRFGWLEVVAMVEGDPSLAALNAGVRQKPVRLAGDGGDGA